MKKRIRNPFYASDFYLERKLSPSGFLVPAATVSTSSTSMDAPPFPGDGPLPPDLPPTVPAGPVGPAY
jgi:hypothetical protein